MKSLILSAVLFSFVLSFKTFANAPTVIELNGVEKELSLEGQAVIENIETLVDAIGGSNDSLDTTPVPESLKGLIGDVNLENSLIPQLKIDCLIFGDGPFCKNTGLAQSLASLPAIEYNYILTNYILPRYMTDVTFQMAIDQLYPVHGQYIKHQLENENVSLSTGGRIVDGFAVGIGAFLGARGIHTLVKNRGSIMRWLRRPHFRKKRVQLPAVIGQSTTGTALVPYKPQSYWSTRSGFLTSVSIAAVTGATCRSASSCFLDTNHYRANMLLAMQIVQTEMACQYAAQVGDMTKDMQGVKVTIKNHAIFREREEEINDLSFRMIYLFGAHEHVLNYQRDSSDRSKSHQMQIEELTRADGWFAGMADLCPSVNLSEKYQELEKMALETEAALQQIQELGDPAKVGPQ